MNPCPCGNFLNAQKECRCSELDIQRYKNRLSDPFLDRIDLCVVMQHVNPNDKAGLSSSDMHKQVIEVHKRVKLRGQNKFTAKLSDAEIEKYCILDSEAKGILDMAVERFALSFRAIKKIQKVSRTIADLDESEVIQKRHVLEALSYRRR
ncbi:MAG: magnesium chelatase family protein [Campylobacterota bacterium]|nr:magnesium chelatase family protein [Campylobacterota bacterium]